MNTEDDEFGTVCIQLEIIGLKLMLSGQKISSESSSNSSPSPPSIPLDELDVRAKTKWTYLPLHIPIPPSSQTQPLILPTYAPKSLQETLLLFVEVWEKKSGEWIGSVEVNIRSIKQAFPNSNNQVLKWLPIRNLIHDDIFGKILLSVEVAWIGGKDKEIQSINQPPQPKSAYFPLLKSKSTPTPPASPASTSTPSPPKSVKDRGTQVLGKLSDGDGDVIDTLKHGLHSLDIEIKKSKEVRTKPKAKPVILTSSNTKSQSARTELQISNENTPPQRLPQTSQAQISIPETTIQGTKKTPRKRRTMGAVFTTVRSTTPPPIN